jgi:hypothetical protein
MIGERSSPHGGGSHVIILCQKKDDVGAADLAALRRWGLVSASWRGQTGAPRRRHRFLEKLAALVVIPA